MTITEKETFADGTWLVSSDRNNGWIDVNFDDSGWAHAMKVVDISSEIAGLGDPFWLYFKVPIVDRDTAGTIIADTLKSEKTKYVPVTMVYFRKSVSVKGLPVSYKIEVVADQAYNLFFNGQYIAQQTNEGSNWTTVHSHDLADFLTKGKNTVAIQVEDVDGTCQGLRAKIVIRILPDWEVMQDSLRPELANEKVQEELILDRGRIP